MPIGAEDKFEGVVDLVNFRGIKWNESDKGMTVTEVPMPADMLGEATEYREKGLEAVAEFDETLMEKYFDDPKSITEDEILAALREATISMKIVPMLCGSSFKNKGVQPLLDCIVRWMPSPLDRGMIKGMDVDNPEKLIELAPDDKSPLAALAFKVLTESDESKVISRILAPPASAINIFPL